MKDTKFLILKSCTFALSYWKVSGPQNKVDSIF